MHDETALLIACIAALAGWACVHRMASAWEYVANCRVQSMESAAPQMPEIVDVPEDLMALAMQENESWAQEELMRVMRERYETYRDWNRVRSAMGLGIRT